MNQRSKNKKQLKMSQNTTDIYLQNKYRNRYSISYASNNNRPELQTIRSFTKKSIQNKQAYTETLAQHNQQPNRYQAKRTGHNFRRQLGKRQQEDETRMSKSPYLKKQLLSKKSTSLNKSNQKIKSSHLMKQISPQLYNQPKSSLSHHADDLTHHRRSSVVSDEKNHLFEEAKQLFHRGKYIPAVDLLRKYLKSSGFSKEGKYYLAMCYINNNNFVTGIQQLVDILAVDPNYKKSIYLVIALAYKKQERVEDAIDILTKGISYFPNYYDLFIYRGKMYLKLTDYERAIKDFDKSIELNSSKGFAYVGKGTCLKQLKKYEQAIETFGQGGNTDMAAQCFQRRGKLYYDLGKYEKALQDFQKCSNLDYNYPSLHFYKGVTNYKLRKFVEAILSFEECLKNDTDKQNLTRSVETMIKIKIQEKDFYEAYHILNRTENIDIRRQIIQIWRVFLEASLFLMKKKIKQGIQTFKTLLNDPFFAKGNEPKNQFDRERYFFIKPLIHLYKGFGQLSEGNIENTKIQYKLFESANGSKSLSKQYNLLIIKAYQNFPKNSFVHLKDAVHLLPAKPEPYLFLAFEKIKTSVALTKQVVEEAIDTLSVGISHLPQLSNNHISCFYYYRSILHLYLNEFKNAVADVDKAVQKSQDNIAKYFYLRGLIFACFGNFTQGVQDLTVCISLDQKFTKAYLERAKCLQIENNSNEAFLDLQKYITLAPDDELIHKYAGFLLFQNCAYEDCLSAFNHGPQSFIDFQVQITQAKCHFLLGNFEQCINLLQSYHQQFGSKQYQVDLLLIKIAKGLNQNFSKEKTQQKIKQLDSLFAKDLSTEGKIFKERDLYQMKASLQILVGSYESAVENMKNCLQLFRKQKKREFDKQFIEDIEQFEQEWSQIEIKYNLSICYLLMKEYKQAYDCLLGFQKSSQKGKQWNQYFEFVRRLVLQNYKSNDQEKNYETFQQTHRLSKDWPEVNIPFLNLTIRMAFSYPFVEPPQMSPQFDNKLFSQFDMKTIQWKPQAPWINRSEKGLVFTSNVQVFDNLQLSRTTTKKQMQQNIDHKPNSHCDKSIQLSQQDIYLQAQALKQKFKLDSQIQLKLKKLLKK